MTTYSIYIVDDEAVARKGLSLALKKKNYIVKAFESAEAVFNAMQNIVPDLVLLDIGLPGMSGVEALKQIRTRYPEVIVIMITAYEDVKTVVSAMKYGAYEYIVKPVQMDSLLVILRNAFDSISMRKEIQILHEKYLKENLPCFIGESNLIQDVMDIVKKVAKSPDTTILVQGETGTGKELIVQAIHYRSPNFQGPLVTVNCAAIPKDLVESELFGYEKGAFSGADKTGKIGMVEQAHEGTLFLDEIGDLSAEAQAKLLRFLESGEYYRVGGTQKHSVKTRVVAATNKELSGLIANGDFREDLYFRLAVVKIEIPSLNERRDDIVSIAKHFLLEFSEKFNKSFTSIEPEAQEALKQFVWTGNVRELRNMIERGVLLADGHTLKVKHLGFESPDNGNGPHNDHKLPLISRDGIDFPGVLEDIEKEYFEEALKLANGNESKAAHLLNMTRDKFRYRRQKLSI